MASETSICNRALQKLGASRISSLTENSNNARSCNACYEELRDDELSKYAWSFAIDRVELAADVAEPAFGKARSYTLPADFLRILAPYPEMDINDRDWTIEGNKIYTNDSDPLQIRYVKRVTNVGEMSVYFREALAARVAMELCEEITQSNMKKADLKSDYLMSISAARNANAMQKVGLESPQDSWITGRS
jgi:hypothetical protein